MGLNGTGTWGGVVACACWWPGACALGDTGTLTCQCVDVGALVSWHVGALAHWGAGVGVGACVGTLESDVCVVWAHGVWVHIGMLVHVGGSVDRIGHVGIGCVHGHWYVGCIGWRWRMGIGARRCTGIWCVGVRCMLACWRRHMGVGVRTVGVSGAHRASMLAVSRKRMLMWGHLSTASLGVLDRIPVMTHTESTTQRVKWQ